MKNTQSEIRIPEFSGQMSTDAWFQIPAETSEPVDIQDTLLAGSEDDNSKVGLQPLAQVLANLARHAQRNFVDPGISCNETITYNFADSDLAPWEAFTRIVQTRGYRIVYLGDIVTLARDQQDSLNPANPHTVKAEVWVWVDQSDKTKPDHSGLVIELAGANAAPNRKPQTVRSLQFGSKAVVSLIDVRSERGDSTLRLTLNPVLLPNGNLEAGLGIDNAIPSLEGHQAVTIRRTINRVVKLATAKQVVEIDGILMLNNDSTAGRQPWIQRLFRKKSPEKVSARMVVKLTVEPVTGSETPIPTDSPVRVPKLNSRKTGIALTNPSKSTSAKPSIGLATTVESAKR
jgi:hypothetical protein